MVKEYINNKSSKRWTHSNTCVYNIGYHLIWCPKYRRKVLIGKIPDRLKELILSKQIEYNYSVLDIEVLSDHVHMILDVNPKDGIYKVVSKIKGFTSHQLRNEFQELKSKLPTLWTNSRFVSTVGSVTLSMVKQYIENQKNK